jgi:hypothetical protein
MVSAGNWRFNNVMIFMDMAICSSKDVYRRFGGICCGNLYFSDFEILMGIVISVLTSDLTFVTISAT